jgi:hypothetical protein
VAAVSSFRSSVVRLGPGQFDGHVGVGQRVRQHRSRARELGFEVAEQAADLCEWGRLGVVRSPRSQRGGWAGY